MPNLQTIPGDALAELQRRPAESFACCITSPPYNLGGTNPLSKAGKGGVPRPGTKPTAYAGFADALPDLDYIAYHRRVLTEILRVLQPDGLLWYVHRRRPDYLARRPLVDEVLASFPVRTEIIWDKGGPGLNHCTAGAGGGYYFPAPAYETIFLLAKTRGGVLARDIAKMGDIWRIPKGKALRMAGYPKHPATFPVALAARCLDATLAAGPVLDPFAGTGTVGVAASAAGRDALLIEGAEEYCGLMRARLSGPEEGLL